MPRLRHDLPQQDRHVAQVTKQVLGDREELLQVGLDPQLGLQGQVGQQDADGGPQALGHDGDVLAGELTARLPGNI